MHFEDRTPLTFLKPRKDSEVSLVSSLQDSLTCSVGLESVETGQTKDEANTFISVITECMCGSFLAPILILHSIMGPCKEFIGKDTDEILKMSGKKKGWNIFKSGTGFVSAAELSRHVTQIHDFLGDVNWKKVSSESQKFLNVIKSTYPNKTPELESIFKKFQQLITNSNTKDGAQLLMVMFCVGLDRAVTINQTNDTKTTTKLLDSLFDYLNNCNFRILKLSEIKPVYNSSRLYDLYTSDFKPYFKIKTDDNLAEVIGVLFSERTERVLCKSINTAMGTKPFKDVLGDAYKPFHEISNTWVDNVDVGNSRTIRFYLTRLITLVDSLMVVAASYEQFETK